LVPFSCLRTHFALNNDPTDVALIVVLEFEDRNPLEALLDEATEALAPAKAPDIVTI
jgi:hypothetical protein